MSDFLNNFDESNYDENKKVKKTTRSKEQKTSVPSVIESAEHDDHLATEYEVDDQDFVDDDDEYRKKRIRKYAIICGLSIVLIISGVFGYRMINQVSVASYVNKPLNELKVWALQNKITVQDEQIFSTEVEEGKVIEQSVAENTKIQKGSTLKVKVSKGADPNEVLKLPDFATMNVVDIENWIEKNKAKNIKVNKEFSETVENGKTISVDIPDKTIKTETYRRKDILNITVSKGKEVFEKNIDMKDFVNTPKTEVEKWARENSIELEFTTEGSDTIMKDSIISQSVKVGEKVAKKDKIQMKVSLGKASTVPSFAKTTKETAMDLGTQNDLQVSVRTEYSNSVPYGKMISQSIGSGTEIYGDKKIVTVIYSEGRPYIDLSGTKENGVAAYFFDLQAKGTSITYSIHYVDGGPEQPRGSVVRTSHDNQYVDFNAHIDVYIAR